MSISDKLTQLSEAKSAIASAIVAKGGAVTGGFSSFANDISNLPSGSESPFGKIIAFNYDVPRNWTATVEEAEI